MTASASSTPLPIQRAARAERTRAPYALRLLAIQAAFGAGVMVEVLEGRWTDGPWLRVGLLSIGLLLLIPPVLGGLLEAMPWVSVPLVVLVLVAKRAMGDPGGALVFLLPWGVAAACALLLTVLEEKCGLRRAAWLAACRDGLWRLAALLAVAISSLAIANRVERGVFEWTFRRPLEGVALSAGILAGTLSFAALVWAAWHLPRLVAERQCTGSILPDAGSDTLWFGLVLCAGGVALDLRGITRLGTFSDALGANCWLALAATAAFAFVRLRLRPVFRADVYNPLWVVYLGSNDSSAKARRHAALLAALWREGPVTVVSEPNVALKSGGAHLRLARMRGRLDALFPQRLIHLADWLETLPPPDRWQAVPIRELYARPSLWPELLGARLETNARIVVIDDSLPDDAVVDRLRVVLPVGRTEVHLPKAVETDRLRARWSNIAVFPFDGPTSVKNWIGLGGPQAEAGAGQRYLMIDYSNHSDELFAMRLQTSLDGARDTRNKVLHAQAVLRTPDADAVATIRAFRNHERQSGWAVPVFFAFAMLSPTRGVSLLARALSRLLLAFPSRRGEEYDLLLLEPRTTQVKAREQLAAATRETDLRLLNRLIGILPEGGGEDPEPTLDPGSYTGTIRIPSADLEQQVATVARRILMLDLDDVRLPAIGTSSRTVTRRRPRVCFSYVETYRELALSLARKLEPICDVEDLEVNLMIGRPLREEIKRLIDRSDAVVAIVGPDTPHGEWARFALEWAQQSRKPILPVFVAPFPDLPELSKLVAANRTPEGANMYLADYAELPGWLDRVLTLTTANIAQELGLNVAAPIASGASTFDVGERTNLPPPGSDQPPGFDPNQPKGRIRL